MASENQYGYTKDNQVYLRPSLGQEDRLLGDVIGTEDDAISYFVKRFEVLEVKINDLQKVIESTNNKGSFLMKVVHLQDSLRTYKGIGDFERLDAQLDSIKDYLNNGIQGNRKKNLSIKEEIINELTVINQNRDWLKGFPQVKELQQRWIKIGRLSDSENEVKEKAFKSQVDHFFDNRQKHIEGLKAANEVRLDKMRTLIEEAKKLSQQDVWKGVGRFKELQADWKSIPRFPGEERQELQNEFQALGHAFFAKVKEGKAQRQKDKSLKRDEVESVKQSLLDRAKRLLTMNLEASIDEAKLLQGEWKETGFLSTGKLGEIQNEFFLNCDKVFEMAYVVKVAKAKYKDFDSLEALEQERIKSSQLKKLIERDKGELLLFEENLDKLRTSDPKSSFRNVIKSRLNNQQRKLRAKESLLTDLINNVSG